MLDKLRENKNSFFINFAIGLVVVVFIFWGSGMSKDQTGNRVIAKVNDKSITESQYEIAVARQLENIRQYFPKNVLQEQEAKIREGIFEQLVDNELLKQEASRLGIVASDYELQKAIIEKPYFKDDNGKFDEKLYKKILQRNPNFELDERNRLTLDKLKAFVMASVYVSEADVKSVFYKEKTEINLEYVKIAPEKFSPDITISDADKKSFVEKNQDKIKASYEKSFDELYNLPKKVQARHILLKYDVTDGDEQKQAIKKKMEQIQEILKSTDFALVAKQFSEDPGSAGKGGDLGFFDEKKMDPAFAKAAFSLEKNQLSNVVESRFGLHIIKVENIEDANIKKLDDVQLEIAEKLLKEEKLQEKTLAVAKELQALWANDKDVKPALDKYGLSVEETGLKTRMGDSLADIGYAPEMADEAFALTKENSYAKKFYTVGKTSHFLIRLKDKKQPLDSDFEAEKDKLMKQSTQEKQESFYESWKDDLKNHAKIKNFINAVPSNA